MINPNDHRAIFKTIAYTEKRIKDNRETVRALRRHSLDAAPRYHKLYDKAIKDFRDVINADVLKVAKLRQEYAERQ